MGDLSLLGTASTICSQTSACLRCCLLITWDPPEEAWEPPPLPYLYGGRANGPQPLCGGGETSISGVFLQPYYGQGLVPGPSSQDSFSLPLSCLFDTQGRVHN